MRALGKQSMQTQMAESHAFERRPTIT